MREPVRVGGASLLAGSYAMIAGCINVSTANAKWFYDFAQRGDVVEVVNSAKKPKLYDPGMSDWNIPWDQWHAGNAKA